MVLAACNQDDVVIADIETSVVPVDTTWWRIDRSEVDDLSYITVALYIIHLYSVSMRGRHDIDTPEALGLALRESRDAAGLSQSEAAASINVSRSTISLAERGNGTLASRTLLALADLYGCALRLAPRQTDPLIAAALDTGTQKNGSATEEP